MRLRYKLSQYLNCNSSFCDLIFVLLYWMQIISTFRKKIWERFLCILRKRWKERSKSVKTIIEPDLTLFNNHSRCCELVPENVKSHP